MKWSATLTTLTLTVLVLSALLTGCASKAYRVCDSTECRPMTKQEAIDAADVSKEWGNKSTLTLGIQKEK